VESSVAEKSVGAEETFDVDVADPEVIKRELLRLSRRTTRALRGSGLAARTIVVKLRKADFTTITRSKTLPEATSETQRLYATACGLFAASGLSGQTRLRLVGVRASGLVPAGSATTQLALGERGASWRDAESALDRISGRFGPEAVRPAALVESTKAQAEPAKVQSARIESAQIASGQIESAQIGSARVDPSQSGLAGRRRQAVRGPRELGKQ
jgi:DNA polymerase-4